MEGVEFGPSRPLPRGVSKDQRSPAGGKATVQKGPSTAGSRVCRKRAMSPITRKAENDRYYGKEESLNNRKHSGGSLFCGLKRCPHPDMGEVTGHLRRGKRGGECDEKKGAVKGRL